MLKKYAATFKPLQLFTVQELFGSLGEAQKVHFNDGGQFDKIYTGASNAAWAEATHRRPHDVAPRLARRPASRRRRRAGVSRRVLPGFNLTLGYTLLYLSLIVLIPLSALVFKTFTLTWDQFWAAVTFAARAGVVPADLRRLADRGAGQRCVRPAGRLGAGALQVSRQAASSTRWSTCRSRCRPRWPASR